MGSHGGTPRSNMPAHNARIAQIMSHLCAAAQEAGSSDVVNEPGFSGSYAGDYKIRDLSLHVRGRKELLMAEVEMPGLMNCRREWGAPKPLSGARVMGSLHMTVQTAVLMETLHAMGADVRWATCNIFSTQDEAAAACVQAKSACVYAWKGQSIAEYWECMDATITWDDGEGMDIIVDDGGDVTLLIHEGFAAEQKFAKDPSYSPAPSSADNEEFACVLATIAKSLKKDPTRFTRMVERLVGVSEETTTGVHRLQMMAKEGSLLFPAINVNDSVTKSKFDNLYGTRHSLPDGLMRATDVILLERKLSSADTVMLVRVAPPPCVRTVASFTSPKLIQSVLFKHVWKVTPSPLSSPFLAPLIFSSLPLVTRVFL